MYVENKETGEARIGRVRFSRTWQTDYYHNKVLQRSGGAAVKGNYFDVATGEEYWVSGCKRRGGDCHWAKQIPVHSDEEVREEYWITIRT